MLLAAAVGVTMLVPAGAFAEGTAGGGQTAVSQQEQQSGQKTGNENVSKDSENAGQENEQKEVEEVQPPKNGFFKKDGAAYYYSKGKVVKGFREIKKSYYYFSKSSGKMASSKAVKFTRTKNGKKKTFYRYFNENGKAMGKGLRKCSDGAKRYGLGKGEFARGWKVLGKGDKMRAYYFFKKNNEVKNAKIGGQAQNTNIKHLKIGKSGKLGSAYARGIKVLNRKGWKLRKAFNYAKAMPYANKQMRRKTISAYANYGFKNRRGNCFVYASQFYVMAKLLGYDATQINGKVFGYETHSWVEIKQKGKVYVYDPEFAWQKHKNGYKIRYKQPGTWRYSDKKVMK